MPTALGMRISLGPMELGLSITVVLIRIFSVLLNVFHANLTPSINFLLNVFHADLI